MGEVALCRALSDSEGALVALKAMTVPYPDPLRDALIRRFEWETLFSIENATSAPSESLSARQNATSPIQIAEQKPCGWPGLIVHGHPALAAVANHPFDRLDRPIEEIHLPA